MTVPFGLVIGRYERPPLSEFLVVVLQLPDKWVLSVHDDDPVQGRRYEPGQTFEDPFLPVRTLTLGPEEWL